MEDQGQIAGSTVQAGVERAGAIVKDVTDRARDALASYREGGFEQVSEDIREYARRQPVTALVIATGVDLLVGIMLGPGRK